MAAPARVMAKIQRDLAVLTEAIARVEAQQAAILALVQTAGPETATTKPATKRRAAKKA